MVETPDFGSLTGDRRVLIDRSQVNANVARQRKLHDLFWGELSLTSAYPQPEGTVKMMKNTNNIRVVLQQEFGGTVDVDDFEFEITDNNALLFSTSREVLISAYATITGTGCTCEPVIDTPVWLWPVVQGL